MQKSTVNPEIAAIEARRREKKISRTDLVQTAHVSARCYAYLLAGTQPQRGTRIRLRRALAHLLGGGPPVRAEQGKIIRAFCQLATLEFARLAALDGGPIEPGTVLETDFTKQRPRNLMWLAAARCRMLAIYLTKVEFEPSHEELAELVGLHKSRIGPLLAKVEDMRDQPEIAAALERVEKIVKGKG